MKRTFRILATFLSIALIICALPQSVLAQIGDLLNDQDTETLETVAQDVYVLGEVIDSRTETSKTFRMSDGSFIAADYGQVIHYAGEDGAWTDYDNTLTFSEASARDIDDMAGYGNTGSNLRIKLANNSNSNNLVKLTMGNYKISLHLVGADKSKALEVYPAMEDPEGNDIDSVATLHKFSSGAIYEDILPDVDLEYIISGGSVKENIIIKDTADSYTYTFELKLHGLVPEVDSEGNILLKDETTDETQLVIPAGYMFDANGAYSDAVTYSIAHKNGKKYTLTVTADAEWINADDRAFPVTVDPTVETIPKEETEYCHYNSSGNTNIQLLAFPLVVGYYGINGSTEYHSIIRPAPAIRTRLSNSELRLLNASLRLTPASVLGDETEIKIGAYEIIDDITSLALDSLSWENAPASVNTPCAIANVVKDEDEDIYLNVTSIVHNWYSRDINTGLVLKPLEESLRENQLAIFAMGNAPVFIIQYEDIDYDKLGTWENYGGVGPISIAANAYNGTLQLNMSDISSSDNVLALDIQHIHSYAFSKNENALNVAKYGYLGKGWTLNIFEEVTYDEEENTIIHVDALGNETIYTVDQEDEEKYVSGGFSCFIREDTDIITFYDGYGGQKTYNSVTHKLLSIRDHHNRVAVFNYSGLRLASIDFKPQNTAITETIKFKYTNNNLTQIEKTKDNITEESVTFEYSTDPDGNPSDTAHKYLRKVTYSSGKTYSYKYNSNGTIQEIEDVTNNSHNRKGEISYVSRSVPTDDNQSAVSSISLRTSKGIAAAYEFEYYPNLTITTANGIELYSAFDSRGNTIRQYYSRPSNTSSLATFCTTNLFQNDILHYQSTHEISEEIPDNVVSNPRFASRSNWTTNHGGTYTSYNVLGSISDVMRITGDRQNLRFSVQTVDGDQLGAGTTFLLSGWVKATDSMPVNDCLPYTGTSFGLSMVVYYSDTSTEEFRVNATAEYNGWQYVSTIVVLKEPATAVDRVNVYCSYDNNTTGSYAYFDEINLSPANATQYEYTSEGLVSKIKTSQGEETRDYFDGKLIESTINYANSDGSDHESQTTEYTYDSWFGRPLFSYNVTEITTDHTKVTYDYDDYGNVEQTIINDRENGYNIVTSQSYDNDRLLTSSTDERGKTTYYYHEYYENMYNLIRTVDPEQNEIRYIYDYQETDNGPYKDIVYLDKNKNGTRDTNEPYIELTKNATDQTKVDSVLANGTEYVYEYDVDNNITSIGIEGITSKLATYTYNAKNQVISKTMGNGFTESYTYDALDNISQISYNNASGATQTLLYTYYADGMLKTITDSATGKTETYTYDQYNRVTEVALADSTTRYLRIQYKYDNLDRVTQIVENSAIYANTYKYTYREASEIVLAVTINGVFRIEYDYDWLDRLQKQTLVNLSSDVEIDSVEYSYIANGENTTRYVSTVGLDNGSLRYTYTNNGYISTIYDSTTRKTVEYFYDANGQLLRENNPYLGKTLIYTYDLAGNITSRSQYALCLGPLGPVLETQTYSYGVGNRLTSLNGNTITYDNAGNPLNWPGYSLSWNGSQLLSCYSACPIAFAYDSLGLRTTKINYGSNTTTTYFYDASGRLIREKRVSNLGQSEDNLIYRYDASGAIIGLTYHPSSGTATLYFFGKNAQGDVICIYDATGNTVARYNYDAWGACTIAYDNTSIGIANINPIRYRSYYYDTETGWYYLQSRYYDPAVGRFISPDDPSLLGVNGDLLSYNLYAYCSNNPVNYSDPSGQGIIAGLVFLGLIIVASAVDGGITAAQMGQNFWKGFAAGTLAGIVGASLIIAFPGAGLLGQIGIRGITSATYGIYNEIFQNGTVSSDALVSIGLDITFDMLFSIYYVDSLPCPQSLVNKNAKKAFGTFLGACVDFVIDVLQTDLIYKPVMKPQAHNSSNAYSWSPWPQLSQSQKQIFDPIYI